MTTTPKTNLQSLMDAIKRAENENIMVFNDGGSEGFIVTSKDKAYNITVFEGEITKCSCPQANTRNVICKHMIKVSMDKNLNISQLNLVAGE